MIEERRSWCDVAAEMAKLNEAECGGDHSKKLTDLASLAESIMKDNLTKAL